MRRSPHRATLADVARAAGVSLATASRVLTGRGHASAYARAMVRQAAADLGYRPHPVAVSLSRGQGYRVVVGVVAPDPAMLTDQYPTRVVSAAGQAADEYQMGVAARWLRPGDTSALADLARDRSVHGLILVNHTAELLDGVPASLRGRVAVIGPGFGRAQYHDVDVAKAMKIRLRHLMAAGRRRIAMLAGPTWVPSLDPPVKVYRADLAAHGLPPRTVSVDRSLKGGRVGAQTVLRRWPDTDAIVAVTDAIALGALVALANAGARIPDDVAVIGFDDVPLAELARPSLTTVTHPVEQIAAGAVRALCAGKVDIDESVVHPVTLVPRQSA